MPKPRAGETEDDFVSRCIPIVIHDGTTDDPIQAAAICHSMWRQAKKKKKPKKKEENMFEGVFFRKQPKEE